jgi:hypothetical protein
MIRVLLGLIRRQPQTAQEYLDELAENAGRRWERQRGEMQ